MPFELGDPLPRLPAIPGTPPRELAPAGTTPFGPVSEAADSPVNFSAALNVPVYRAETSVPTNPIERQQQLETGLRREGRW